MATKGQSSQKEAKTKVKKVAISFSHEEVSTSFLFRTVTNLEKYKKNPNQMTKDIFSGLSKIPLVGHEDSEYLRTIIYLFFNNPDKFDDKVIKKVAKAVINNIENRVKLQDLRYCNFSNVLISFPIGNSVCQDIVDEMISKRKESLENKELTIDLTIPYVIPANLT